MTICREQVSENFMKTRNFPIPFLVLGSPLQNGSVIACSAAESVVAMMAKRN